METTTYRFRIAEPKDIDEIWQIINDAKAQMRRLGSHQWQDNYPSLERFQEDITKGYGYVLDNAEGIIAYGAVIFTGEPSYPAIIGKWIDDEPYVVVHRLAVAERAKKRGIATLFMKEVETLSRSCGVNRFRVDTNFDNHYMLHLLEKSGFVYRGSVDYGIRGKRMAFDKVL